MKALEKRANEIGKTLDTSANIALSELQSIQLEHDVLPEDPSEPHVKDSYATEITARSKATGCDVYLARASSSTKHGLVHFKENVTNQEALTAFLNKSLHQL